jgi:serine/threonine protein kinase
MTVVVSSSKYSAPEMFEEAAESVDNSSHDSYVLGLVFYEIFLGRDLFEKQFQEISGQGEVGWLIWHADKTKRAESLSDLISGFPYILSRLIDGMMVKEPSKRITDLNKVAETIASTLQATAVYSTLAASHVGDEPFTPQKPSVRQGFVDIRNWFTTSPLGGLWKALLGRISRGQHEPARASIREAEDLSSRNRAKPSHSAQPHRSSRR